MSFMHDLVHGADNKFDHMSLNALQKATLRAVSFHFYFMDWQR
jgi:cytochrome c oxidase subunit 1